jgi:hypothetical protein
MTSSEVKGEKSEIIHLIGGWWNTMVHGIGAIVCSMSLKYVCTLKISKKCSE